MTDGEQQGALELTEQEELELRQLSELILETDVSDELFRDIRELSEPVLSIVRSGSELEFWSVPSGEEQRSVWASFNAYSALDAILRDLLLGARDENADPDLEDRQLTEAAEVYGFRQIIEEQIASGSLDEDYEPLHQAELESFQARLQDKLGVLVPLEELTELVGNSTPDFVQDARTYSWFDPAVIEAATNFYLDSLGDQELEEIIEDSDYPISEEERESFVRKLGELIEGRVESVTLSFGAEAIDVRFEDKELEEEVPEDYAPRALTDVEELVVNDPRVIATHEEMTAHPELWTVADDLSPEESPADTSDDGEWGVAEIDGGGQSEGDEDFAVELIGDEVEESEHSHHGHVHQILGDELRGLDDYDGEPADERETATLALIAEGIVFAELSEILLQDLLAEADPLIRKSRVNGPEWWLTIEAAEDVADLISRLLSGNPWPIWAPGTSDEVLRREGNAHQDRLRRLALSYPLDPEPTRAERLASLKPAERYEMLLEERGERTAEDLTEDEVGAIGAVIRNGFVDTPTRSLARDVANLYSDDAIYQGRSWGWQRATAKEVRRILQELLGGVEAQGENSTASQTPEESAAFHALIRSYKTEELTEDEFIAHYDARRWPSVGATVDLSIFTILDGKLQVLLIERGNHPELGKWALPGGFVDIGESLDQAAVRELLEETGVDLSEGGYIEQVKTYGYPGRDRRGYIISTLYATLLSEAPAVLAGDDAAKARFVPVEEALGGELELAFDHSVLLADALERIRAKLEYAPVAFDFLPESFEISELRSVYETVWGFEILPSDFWRRISQAQGSLTQGERTEDGRQLWGRGDAENFFPPLDRRQMVQQD